MKNIYKKIMFATATCALITGVNATATPDNPLVNQNREAVSFSWAIQNGYSPSPVDALSNTEESVEYWQTVSASELSKGVDISTTAPGALVRISELGSNKQARGIDPLNLEIETASGKKFSNGKAMSVKVSPQAMRDAGSPFPDGTAGFKLKPSIGHGKFKIRETKIASSNAQYTLHVFDKNSTKRLSVTREKTDYKAGSLLSLDGDLTDSASGKHRPMKINNISGYVLSPKGNSMPLKIKRGVAGQFKATLALSAEPEFGGLYEAYIDASSIENGISVKRRVKTAFAILKTTANIGLVNAGTLKSGLPVDLAIQESGRFEVRGVLYGSNSNGDMSPIMATSTAQWLEAGKSQLKLTFDPDLLASSSLKAPFELRHLQLMDQSRMGNLHISSDTVSIFE